MQPPGTPEAAYLAFAIVDELIRTLVGRGDLTKQDATDLLRRTIATMGTKALAANCATIVKELIAEYSK
jgi:hypothetical protein